MQKRPLDILCIHYKVGNAFELDQFATEIDQMLMRTRRWDYRNPRLINNQIKNAVEKLDRKGMSKSEHFWIDQILWFWHHHAITCALERYYDENSAREHATKALKYQERMQGHPNRITNLLYLLVHHRVAEARQWVTQMRAEKHPETRTAQAILNEYRKTGNLFGK